MDANCGYDVGTAIDVGRKLAHNDLFWYEEPLPTDDVRGYLEVKRAVPIRIAGAEGLAGCRAFRELIQQRALDIVQPDISIAGGFSECRNIAAMAHANYVRVLPHHVGRAYPPGRHRALASHHTPTRPMCSILFHPCLNTT